jgi:2-alkyl-3-oxoalkanoate reductase
VADALDPAAVMDAVRQAQPEIVVHELLDLHNFDRGFAETNRLRKEGTDYLLVSRLPIAVK